MWNFNNLIWPKQKQEFCYELVGDNFFALIWDLVSVSKRMAKILFCLLVYLKSDACSPLSCNKSHFYQKCENMRSSCVEQYKVWSKTPCLDDIEKRRETRKPSFLPIASNFSFLRPPAFECLALICQQLYFILAAWVSYGDPEFFLQKNLITCDRNLLTLRWKKLSSLVLLHYG